ncbi:hypothetical protein EZV62_014621 [Acer yangbiense]|uniref:Protein kinase domain-containing protein n=1 Tax=Acer yangbiense TaxID=1000413 RepID=A0A5C7HT69_9ROSI|nr:hypothetical protein EZV62_014621 [Acer yangbiense]
MATSFFNLRSLSIFVFYLLLIPSANSISFNISCFDPDNPDILYEGDARAYVGAVEFNGISYLCCVGRAAYAKREHLWDSETNKMSDFTTHFSFIINTGGRSLYAAGLAFYLAPFGYQIPPNSAGGFLGLFNTTTSDSSQNRIVLVQFDSFPNPEWDPPVAHVGINNNSLWNASFHSGDIADVSITYNATTKNMSVSWTYQQTSDWQEFSTLSYQIDLMKILPEWVSIGFSAATSRLAERHQLLSWEFSSSLNTEETNEKKVERIRLEVGIAASVGILIAGAVIAYYISWTQNYKNNEEEEAINLASINDDLEKGSGPKRFSIKDLLLATKKFSKDRKLGEGGFGAVYKGYSIDFDMPIAVKRISKGSKQGKRKYIIEVKIISQLKHRNLVQLIGWCHDRGEFLLVYELMPNGSLDSHLFGKTSSPLSWAVRKAIDPLEQNFQTTLVEWIWELYGEGDILSAVDERLHIFDEKQAECLMIATYANRVPLWDSNTGRLSDFSTSFSFTIDTMGHTPYGHGLAFFLAPVKFQIPPNSASGFLGLLNTTTIDSSSNQIVMVEFDSFKNVEWDPSDVEDHVGINKNSLSSDVYTRWNASFHSGDTADVQITYNGTTKNLSVSWRYRETLNSQENTSLFYIIDLTKILPEYVTVGFSAATGTNSGKHTLESWEFSSALDVKETRKMDAKKIGITVGVTVSMGRASKESDVYSFGVVALEIAMGKKPASPMKEDPKMGLVEWVWDLYGRGQVLSGVDEKLDTNFDEQQMERLMIVGLWCAHPDSNFRPSIRQAIQVLNFETAMPNLPNKMHVPMFYVPTPSSVSSSEPFVTNSSIDAGRNLGPKTTGLAGTLGYLAPEYISTGRASKESDIYSFRVVALEIATGKKSAGPMKEDPGMGLVEWVWDLYGRGQVLSGVDEKLDTNFDEQQMERLMIVGLWCAHPDSNFRPSIRQAIQVLNFETAMPNLPNKMPVPMLYVPTPSSVSSSEPFVTNSSIDVGR